MSHLQKVNLFSLECSHWGRSPKRAHLLLQNYPTGRKVKGKQIVDQYSVGQRYIVITNDDNPYEEVLHIYLLDLELNILDEMELSQPFTSGVYQPCRHSGECLEFRFFDENTWCLEVRNQPKPKPLNIDNFPISRPIKLWGQQYLRLSPAQSVVA